MDELTLKQIKSLGLDMIDKAKSGHPGIVLSASPIIYALYTYHLKFNPLDSNWINRDRFILSCGHASALLYAMNYAAGFKLSIDDLKNFRQIDSHTPGHPEYDLKYGIESSTGPLGQGFANGVGIALGERYLNKITNNLIDYNTYVLCSDGDLMEGISYESASFAGNQKLNKLIVLYDSNDICLDGKLNKTFNDDIQRRFESLNWNYIKVSDGNNIDLISKSIEEAKISSKPTLIEIKTIIGKDSVLENTNEVHGKPLSKDDLLNIKTKLELPTESFSIDNYTFLTYQERLKEKIINSYNDWLEKLNEKPNVLDELFNSNTINFNDLVYPTEEKELRDYNQIILEYIASKTNDFIGGSADLASSTKTYLRNFNDLDIENNGKNIWFGVREHAMGAISNGLSLSGLRPYASTFLVFSDYLKPTIRLSALINLNTTFIFSHDSIMLGEDGPTHQPIEQLGNLRSIPNVDVYRPYDFNELVGSWESILKNNKTACLVINKNKTPINVGNKDLIKNGAYVISSEQDSLDGILIASGSEVELALKIQKRLLNEGKDIRVVSMPSTELFDKTNEMYKYQILPVGVKKIVLELSNDYKLLKYLTNEKYLINLNQFGASGKKDDVLDKFEFTEEKILSKIISML